MLPFSSQQRGFSAYPAPSCKAPLWLWAVTAVAALYLAYVYITGVHNVADLGQIAQATSALMLPAADERCRHAGNGMYRCLANVMFIGASKCGTTSLANHLGFHPGVAFIQRRMDIEGVHEIHRFDRPSYGYALKIIDIADELASSPLIRNKSMPMIHYTPHYLYAPTVPFEMREFYPNPDTLKFIIMLREPVSRAISSYWFKNSHLFDDKAKDRGSVEKFTKEVYQMMVERQRYDHCRNQHRGLDEMTILRQCFGPMRDSNLGKRHIDKGIFYDQLERWFSLYPRENFLIVTLEDFSKDPLTEFEKVCKFLGVDMVGRNAFNSTEAVQKILAKSYLGSPNKRKESLPPKVLEDMTNFYRPFNRKLEELLGRKLGYPT